MTTQMMFADCGTAFVPMTFTQWQEYSRKVNAIADRVTKSRQNRGWALAATVGIDRCYCSLHNASIDTDYKGWCAGPDGHKRLKVARAAVRLVGDLAWEPGRIAKRIVARAWERIVWPNDTAE